MFNLIDWLSSIGLSFNGDYAFIAQCAGAVLAIIIVVLTTSMLFGVVNAIFRR